MKTTLFETSSRVSYQTDCGIHMYYTVIRFLYGYDSAAEKSEKTYERNFGPLTWCAASSYLLAENRTTRSQRCISTHTCTFKVGRHFISALIIWSNRFELYIYIYYIRSARAVFYFFIRPIFEMCIFWSDFEHKYYRVLYARWPCEILTLPHINIIRIARVSIVYTLVYSFIIYLVRSPSKLLVFQKYKTLLLRYSSMKTCTQFSNEVRIENGGQWPTKQSVIRLRDAV